LGRRSSGHANLEGLQDLSDLRNFSRRWDDDDF